MRHVYLEMRLHGKLLTAGARVHSLIGKLRSHMLQGIAKKKKRERERERKREKEFLVAQLYVLFFMGIKPYNEYIIPMDTIP